MKKTWMDGWLIETRKTRGKYFVKGKLCLAKGANKMDRPIRYVFPKHRIPKGSRVLIYGYGDMGKDYLDFLYTTNYSEIVAVTDKNYDILAHVKYCVNTCRISDITNWVFDYIIIASTNYHNEIRQFLIDAGVYVEKIIYTEIYESARLSLEIANIAIDYLISYKQNGDVLPTNNRNFVQTYLCEALEKYTKADFLDLPNVTLDLIDRFSCCDRRALRYGYENERLFYGHMAHLTEYAGLQMDFDNLFMLPSCYHGSYFYKPVNTHVHAPIAFSFHEINYANQPTIAIGPLIAYTKPSLSEDRLRSLKRHLGKTLTIFFAHTSISKTHSKMNDTAYIRNIVRSKSNMYDSILLCIYYNDLTQELLSFCNSVGIIPVTAGVRTDQNFIANVRTIHEITDDAVFFSYWGDSLSYSIYLGKNVYYYDIGLKYGFEMYVNEKYPEIEAYKKTMRQHLVSGEQICPSICASIVDMYGHDKVRSQVSIRSLFEINRTIYDRAFGDSSEFLCISKQYLGELSTVESDNDGKKFELLSEALSAVCE